MATSETPKRKRPDSPLKQARKDLGMRQADVAKRAGCSVSLISMTESGYEPTLDVQSAIAGAVGASSGSFWT